MNNLPIWINYLSAFGAIATPVLVAILSGIGWRIRSKIEFQLNLEKKLQEDRLSIYNEVVEPFMILLMSEEAWKSDPKNSNKNKNTFSSRKLLSVEYRKTAFRLALLGSDRVVSAYNDLMQYFFENVKKENLISPEELAFEMMSRIGNLMLEIRRSMGNSETDLDNWAMVEWFFHDARNSREKK